MQSPPNYRIIRVIGSGVFGFVFEAEDIATKKRVALKRIEKASDALSREYEILQMIQGCNNIVKIEDFFYSRNARNKVIQNMVFEYVESSLEGLIAQHFKKGTHIPEYTIKNYTHQLLKGLAWIHSHGITHRDLKPENILLSKQGIIKICDFGCSKILNSAGKNTPFIVSRFYRAPELIMCVTKYSVEVDVWAAGCILAELVLLEPLFRGGSEGEQMFKILEVLGSMGEEEVAVFKTQVPFKEAIFSKFEGFPRRNLEELFGVVEDKHNFINLLSRMLEYLPQKRITAAEALNHPFFQDLHATTAETDPPSHLT